MGKLTPRVSVPQTTLSRPAWWMPTPWRREDGNIEHRTPNIGHRSGRKWDSVLAGESEDFDAGNGVEVWVAMHEDETRCVRDSGDEGIGQRQTAWCGISQTDRGEGGFGVHGKEGGQADGVLQEDILPLCHLGH